MRTRHADGGAERRARGLRRAEAGMRPQRLRRRAPGSFPGLFALQGPAFPAVPGYLPLRVSAYSLASMEASDRAVRVLVVEDDQEIAQVLQRALRLEGYDVRLAGDGITALDEVHAFLPDIIVLDLGLPRMDGIDVARRLRKDEDDTPILMLTARDALDARVEGLDVGADDYLVKPFERQELLARMRALLRRRPPRGMAPLRVGDLTLNPDTHEVRRGEREIELTQREFELLEYLMRNERLVISRQKLLDEVWGYDPFSITNTIEVFVSNLRRKLEAGGEPRLLHTVRGAGYVLRV